MKKFERSKTILESSENIETHFQIEKFKKDKNNNKKKKTSLLKTKKKQKKVLKKKKQMKKLLDKVEKRLYKNLLSTHIFMYQEYNLNNCPFF